VINLFYGWVPLYVDRYYLQPLPVEAFPPMELEREFVPMIKNSKFDGKYWAVPTAVRSLALFYNMDLLRAAGFSRAPVTWEEFATMAERTTESALERSAAGRPGLETVMIGLFR